MRMAGMLYLCATPIGNLEDITFRALRILKEADLVAAEDTRNSIRLFNHFDIKTPLTSYHEHNKTEKAYQLIEKMRKGQNVALITDAGMPGISDPGEELVRLCLEEGIKVTALPGASACITALVMSGQKTRRFSFEAFLPRDKKERAEVLKEMAKDTRTMVVYEAPHHLSATLKELNEALGDRSVTVCREITKKFEEARKTSLAQAAAFYETETPRGEFVLVIEGKDRKEIRKEEIASWEELSVEEHMALYENRGIDRKEAMKAVAKDRGISKREVYAMLLQPDQSGRH